MAGIRKSKAKKLQAKASEATGRSRKGRNKVPTITRTDSKKGGPRSGERRGSRGNA